jgi:hypothetical protein
MIYCPRCGLTFHPAQKQLNFRDDNLDGAYFGTTFAHLLLMQVRQFCSCSHICSLVLTWFQIFRTYLVSRP